MKNSSSTMNNLHVLLGAEGRCIYLSVTLYNGVPKVQMRYHRREPNGQMRATKDGIAMNTGEWERLKSFINDVDHNLADLHAFVNAQRGPPNSSTMNMRLEESHLDEPRLGEPRLGAPLLREPLLREPRLGAQIGRGHNARSNSLSDTRRPHSDGEGSAHESLSRQHFNPGEY